MPVKTVPVETLATEANFDERRYVAANPDVAAVLAAFGSGFAHFKKFGQAEGRRLLGDDLDPVRAEKMNRLEPLLRQELPHERRGLKWDFLTNELRVSTGITATKNVSSNDYDEDGVALIEEFADGLVLDCGAGRRSTYYANVVNFEIVDYDTTDVVGVGEELPFVDGAFDAVLSIAVLEHVRDPFKCASEIARVLKPGGKLLCCVPFLQPLHGYPHHYYNMSHQGLRALFERHLDVDKQMVTPSISPIWSLTWILNSWAAGLEAAVRKEFEGMRVRDLMGPPPIYLNAPWVKGLSEEKTFELASATTLMAHRPK